MRVQITWTDPNTQQVRSPTLETPIAFGCEFGEMPTVMQNKAVRRMVLASEAVAPFHAIMADAKGGIAILNRQDDKQTLVNGTAAPIQRVSNGDRITIGPFEITVAVLSSEPAPAQSDPFAGMTPPAASQTANQSDSPAANLVDNQSVTNPASIPTAPMTAPRSSQVASGVAGGMMMGLAGNSSEDGVGNRHSSSASSTGENPASFFGPDGTCTRKVGFLFKRPCGRTTTAGCPDCKNGQVVPGADYQNDYAYYPNYGCYDRGHWGHDYYHRRHHYHYDPHSRDVDFNESDAASFVEEGDRDYEMDLDAS